MRLERCLNVIQYKNAACEDEDPPPEGAKPVRKNKVFLRGAVRTGGGYE